MLLAKTTAGNVWNKLINAECLTNMNRNLGNPPLSQLTDAVEQLSHLDTSEAVYLSSNGNPSIRVSDIMKTINKRIARYQSIASLMRP